jgi:hypothetical protein
MQLLTLILVVLFISAPNPSDKGEPILVHVKEVHRIQNDEEATEKGNWFHLTATVETKTVVYSLRCDEYFSTPDHKFSAGCFHLSAGKDYPALKFPTAISFWQPGERHDFTMVMYDITSEKEK